MDGSSDTATGPAGVDAARPSLVARLQERADRFQQGRRAPSFVVGVFLRYRDDRGSRWAATVGYYSFFSIFPLLLSFVTVLGIVLEDRPELRDDIVDSALGRFPVIGKDMTVESLSGSPLVVAFGLLAALWAGLGAVQAIQDAMNTMWSVPNTERPTFVAKRLRSLAMLVVLAVGIIASSFVAGLGSSGVELARVAFVVTVAGSVLINVGLVAGSYRILTRIPLRLPQVLPGAVFAGLALFALQTAGTLYVRHVLDGASDTYGVFATVIGLLTWLTLQAQVVLLGTAINVVRDRHFWPRSIRAGFPTEADERALRDIVLREATMKGLTVDLVVRASDPPVR